MPKPKSKKQQPWYVFWDPDEPWYKGAFSFAFNEWKDSVKLAWSVKQPLGFVLALFNGIVGGIALGVTVAVIGALACTWNGLIKGFGEIIGGLWKPFKAIFTKKIDGKPVTFWGGLKYCFGSIFKGAAKMVLGAAGLGLIGAAVYAAPITVPLVGGVVAGGIYAANAADNAISGKNKENSPETEKQENQSTPSDDFTSKPRKSFAANVRQQQTAQHQQQYQHQQVQNPKTQRHHQGMPQRRPQQNVAQQSQQSHQHQPLPHYARQQPAQPQSQQYAHYMQQQQPVHQSFSMPAQFQSPQPQSTYQYGPIQPQYVQAHMPQQYYQQYQQHMPPQPVHPLPMQGLTYHGTLAAPPPHYTTWDQGQPQWQQRQPMQQGLPQQAQGNANAYNPQQAQTYGQQQYGAQSQSQQFASRIQDYQGQATQFTSADKKSSTPGSTQLFNIDKKNAEVAAQAAQRNAQTQAELKKTVEPQPADSDTSPPQGTTPKGPRG